MAVLKMAQQSKSTNTNNANTSTHLQHQQQVKPTMFHDFLGMKATDSPVVLAPKATDARFSEASASASASVGASSGGGGAGRGPISSTSDLGSERQVGNHLDGIPYYGPRSEISGPEISNILIGSKRGNSDSAFMGHESLESLHLMKVFVISYHVLPLYSPNQREAPFVVSHLYLLNNFLYICTQMLRNGAVGERPRRSNEDEVVLGMQPMRPSSVSLMLQSPTGSRLEGNSSKCERSVPMIGSAVQCASRGGHFVPFVHQVSSNRFKDTNVGPSVISQAAADEGSRTGIKGPGILSSINASSVPTEKPSSGVIQSAGRLKSGAHISDPESSVPTSRQGLTTAGRQMTIFYAGQAHVFDDVHPNKADVIMALAGSNGGSWSTTFSPKSAVRPVSENYVPSGEPEAVGSMAFSREFRGRIAVAGNTSQGTGSGERISIQTGLPQGTVFIAKDARNPAQAAEPSAIHKRKVQSYGSSK
ncbi:protein TIFY 8-like isoform X2 [Durio zibethinus]|uniref:Protein TIFY n=1 Tax=Durio zibethinus TaxID=66656 RepID=A0A6P5ZRG0_DURZI|nr:protein TIFY 8-like isoform X2 [Durio zibethinus]